MIEDKIPEVLAELRLGHEIPGIRGAYSHTSEQMRQELKDALQARWENSLKARFVLAPNSLVPALDKLLVPLRETGPESERNLASQIPPTGTPNAVIRVA